MIRYSLLLVFCLMPATSFGFECATSRCYSDIFTTSTPSTLPELDRVYNIFDKLNRTIGSTRAKRSRLLVIESEGYPWAVALSDNTVVITSGVIKRMYRNSDTELGDARAAFVLGHELSHLETEDLFHHRAFAANETISGSQIPGLRLWQQRPEEELRADLRGFTYASVAGYKTDRLLDKGNDFFLDWLPPSNKVKNTTHPDNETRSKYLNEGFNKILRDVPYYRYATVLAHFGRYRDAQHLFEDFLNRVETKEAFSNLGYVHLQRARQEMPVQLAYKYWFPTLLEPASGLSISRNRGLFEEELPPAALHHLEKAEQYLQEAIRMDDTQLVSYINLAAVYLYMPDKLHRAYAAIEDAKRTRLAENLVIRQQLESIYQIIRLQDSYEATDNWPKARDALEQLARQPGAAENLLYNLARLLDDRGRDDTALVYWNQLYDRLALMPRPYQDQVCFRLRKDNCGSAASSAYPVQIKGSLLQKDIRYPDTKRYLKETWNVNSPAEKLLPDLKAQVYLNSEGDSLLALDDHVEMMIFRDVPVEFRNLTALLTRFGNPVVSLPLNDGQILSFGNIWSAFVQDNFVKEIWVSDLSAITAGRNP